MNRIAKFELLTLGAALMLGVLGDALLNAPWGLNFAIWGCALTATVAVLGRFRKEVFAGGGGWLLLTMAGCSLSFLWRDSWSLAAISLLGFVTSCSLLIQRAHGGRLWVSSLSAYTVSVFVAGLNSTLGMFPLLFGVREWKKVSNGDSRYAGALLRGVLLALPPLVVFGMLFVAADGVFKELLGRLFDFDLTHILLIGLFTFLSGGYLRGLLFGDEWKNVQRSRLTPSRLGAIEAGTILGLVDLLFLIFVFIQIRYFFGGSEHVKMTAGLTYSEYARSGFWALFAVALILLPLLLVIHWLLDPQDAGTQRVFKWLAGIQIALLFVIMASAFERMHLYIREYGLSEDRLYPLAYMAWLAVVFVWFCLTVLRGRRENFAFGAMVAGFLLIAVLNIINPDALIVRTNILRARERRTFDAGYLIGLSADAIPEVINGWPGLDHTDQCRLRHYLLDAWVPQPFANGWRSWDISRARARQAVGKHLEIQTLDCSPAKRLTPPSPEPNLNHS
jgi:hypothetical protein